MALVQRIISNRSRVRRLLLLRKFQYKMRSLKRTKFCSRIYNKKVGREYALESAFFRVIDFLRCSYQDIQDPLVKNAVNSLVNSLERLASNIDTYRRRNKSIPMCYILPCTISIRRLYMIARRTKPNYDCDRFWQDFGLVLIVLFNIT